MPNGRGMKGVSSKEKRMYEHIKESAQRSGRYGQRAKEVAARTVMKQHSQKGHSNPEALLKPNPIEEKECPTCGMEESHWEGPGYKKSDQS